jgi:hypothetical protein
MIKTEKIKKTLQAHLNSFSYLFKIFKETCLNKKIIIRNEWNPNDVLLLQQQLAFDINTQRIILDKIYN